MCSLEVLQPTKKHLLYFDCPEIAKLCGVWIFLTLFLPYNEILLQWEMKHGNYSTFSTKKQDLSWTLPLC